MSRLPLLLFLLSAGAGIAAELPLAGLLQESRKWAAELETRVNQEIETELARSGVIAAITVCKHTVIDITSALSRRTGARVTRVSLKPRNPLLGSPDAWEQKVLLDFEKRARTGPRRVLEHSEVVEEPGGRYFRYMRSIAFEPQCLVCHDAAHRMSESLRARIASDYPFDKATAYTPGDIRGATTVKRPL